MTNVLSPQICKYKISRRGRKLQISDDSRTILALPKEVSERTWIEILQKEENDLIVFDIREEILEDALKIGYEHYMEKQNAPYQVHCAAQAWLKLIDWHFYRHDPGEEPSAYPPCFIPKRVESWIPDELPAPSPKDSWCRQQLDVVEDTPEESLRRWPSNTSLDMPVIEEIPCEYWFPGKVNWPDDERHVADHHTLPHTDSYGSEISSVDLAADSELVQRVTDYSTVELLDKKESSGGFSPPKNTPVEGSLHGAGDSTVVKERRKHDKKYASRVSVTGRSRGALPPLTDSRSRVSLISDCRMRNLRLDTHYEISSEKLDTPPGQPAKRK